MAFRVNRTYPKILRNRKQRIARRLEAKRRWEAQAQPMLSARNIHFEMAQRGRAVNCGGIGALHLMGHKLGLAEEIDRRLHLLKRHLPYHESDSCAHPGLQRPIGGPAARRHRATPQ